MADRIPIKAVLAGGAAVALGEFEVGDTLAIEHGGTGAATTDGARTALGLDALLDAKVDTSDLGVTVATLDGGGKIPAAQLPSYVDDVIEVANVVALPGTGEAGKIYVTLDTNKCYRWSGTAYVEISPSPGSTDSVTEGSTNLYFTVARVRAAVLTGLSTASAAVITATSTVLEALGQLQAQVSAIAASLVDMLPATGDFKFVMRASAPSGWIAGDGSTIGSASSGATRTGTTYQALFTAWWTDYSDAQLPILTSAGGASTRGASAAADWAANKRLTVFDVRKTFPRAADGSAVVNGTKYEGTLVFDNGGNANSVMIVPTTAGRLTENGDGLITMPSREWNQVSPNGAANNTQLNGTKVRPDNIGMLGCFKL